MNGNFSSMVHDGASYFILFSLKDKRNIPAHGCFVAWI